MNLPAHHRGTLLHATVPAAAAYALAAFGIGFACGTLRALLLTPMLGAVSAVLLELPVMLSACWLLAGWSIRRYGIEAKAVARALMGLSSLAFLMSLEFLFAMLVLCQSPGRYLGELTTLAGHLGLAGQLLFGAIPALHLVKRRAGTSA